tara:strand:- start:307 stop:630 length:324 start_codon:yes stop_codon:yes gene_type:complete
MISSIVDSSGLLVYKGNDVDSKFATVLAREGHSRIDVNSPDHEKIKWDGSAWVESKTDMELYMEEIERLESTVTPRRMRDAVASVEGKTWLADIESKIAIERVKLNG